MEDETPEKIDQHLDPDEVETDLGDLPGDADAPDDSADGDLLDGYGADEGIDTDESTDEQTPDQGDLPESAEGVDPNYDWNEEPALDSEDWDSTAPVTPLRDADGGFLPENEDGDDADNDEGEIATEDDPIPDDDAWDAVPDEPLGFAEPMPDEDDEDYVAATSNLEDFDTADEEGGTDEDGASDDLTLDKIEIQAKQADSEVWNTVTTVDADAESIDLPDMPPAEKWQFRVRDIYTDGTFSNWSAPVDVDVPADLISPNAPSTPQVEGSVGYATVKWDGLDYQGNAMPPDFAFLVMWTSPSGDPGTWTRHTSMTGPGSSTFTDLKLGVPYYFVFTAVDNSGNESDMSTAVQVVAKENIDPDAIREELDASAAELEAAQADIAQAKTDAADAKAQVADAKAAADQAAADVVNVNGELQAAKGDIAQARSDAGSALTKVGKVEADLLLVGDGTLIQDGAITTGKLAADAVTADKVAANSITADKLLVTGSELMPDPYYDQGSLTYSGGEFSADAALSGHSQGLVLRSAATGSSSMSRYAPGVLASMRIPVQPGEVYEGYMWVYSTDGLTGLTDAGNDYSGVNLQIYGYNNTTTQSGEDGTRPQIGYANSVQPTFPKGQWVKVGGQFTIPEGTTYIAPVPTLYFPKTAQAFTGQVYIGRVSIRKGVGSTLIEDGAITTGKLTANAVTADKVAASAISADKIAANAVTADKVAANAITAGKISANAVTSREIKALSITGDKIAANTIDAANIKAGAITADLLNADAIDGKSIHGARLSGGSIYIDDKEGGGYVFMTDGGMLLGFDADYSPGSVVGQADSAGASIAIMSPLAKASGKQGKLLVSDDSKGSGTKTYIATDSIITDATTFQANGGMTFSGASVDGGKSDMRIQSISDTASLSSVAGGNKFEAYNNGTVWMIANKTGRIHLAQSAKGCEYNIDGSSGEHQWQMAGTRVLTLEKDAGKIVSPPTYKNTTTSDANVYVTSYGTFYRSTSSAKAKLDIVDLPQEQIDALLNVKPRMWYDKGESERLAEYLDAYYDDTKDESDIIDVPSELRRIPGVVAEEVEEAGADLFVTKERSDDGTYEITGVNYDRIGAALLSVVKEQREQIAAQSSQIADLTARLEALEAAQSA